MELLCPRKGQHKTFCMRFPNIFQTILLIFLLIIFHLLLTRFITLPEQDNLKSLIVSAIKVVVLIGSISILSKQGSIDNQNVGIKRPNLYLYLMGVVIGILIVFNPTLGSISFFNVEDIIKYADSIMAKPVDVYVFLNVVILTPIFEELLFRRVIFSGLKSNYNTVTALFLSSLLFGVFHIDVLEATVFGLWLGWIFLKTKDLLLCITVHSVCNLISFGFRVIAKVDPEKTVFIYILENEVIISTIMFALAIILFYLSAKKDGFVSRELEKQR